MRRLTPIFINRVAAACAFFVGGLGQHIAPILPKGLANELQQVRDADG